MSTRATLPPHLLHNGVAEPVANGALRAPSPRVNAGGGSRGAHEPTVKGKKVARETADTKGGGRHNPDPPIEAVPVRYDVAVAKLRLYLAARMLQAVRCSPNGGFGIPVDCVRQEMTKEFGEVLVESLFGNTSANALILNECGDIVELMPLRVQQLTKNGCVPSTQFRRDSTNMEARIRADSLAIIARAEAEVEAWEANQRLETEFYEQTEEVEPPNDPDPQPQEPTLQEALAGNPGQVIHASG